MMTETNETSLKHFPIALFTSVMGVWGWALATNAAAMAGFVPSVVADALRILASCVTIAVSGAYVVKAVRWPQACIQEWQAPPTLAFFPAVSISLLLVTIGYQEIAPGFSAALWPFAVALQGLLTLAVISSWISHRPFQIGQLSPAWFIPAVGNVIVPVAGVPLGYHELSWLFFSGGLVFWIVLLTLVINRLMFHDPLPERLLPTLVIMIAPPALAFVAYVTLNNGVDNFARILLNIAYVFALLVIVQAPKFRHLPFALSWWALSFPVAGLTIASFRFAAETGADFYAFVGLCALGVLSLSLVGLLTKTTLVLLKGGFFRSEG